MKETYSNLQYFNCFHLLEPQMHFVQHSLSKLSEKQDAIPSAFEYDAIPVIKGISSLIYIVYVKCSQTHN